MAKKYKYNKNEFIGILCERCKLCKNIEDPAFCYDAIYKRYKKKFIQKVFPKLLGLKTKEKLSGILICDHSSEDFKLMFKQTFCDTGVCRKNVGDCINITKCTTMFRLQLYGIKSTTKLSSSKCKIRKHKIKKGNRNRYIAKPYPTFFSNEEQ